MNKLDYQKAAERTCPPLDTPAMDHTHMIMGILDEWYETKDEISNMESTGPDAKENIIKELGDVFWYVANYCRMFKIDFTNGRDIGMAYDTIAVKLIGIHKKELAYGKDVVWEEVNYLMQGILYWLDLTCELLDVNQSDVFERNIKKVTARFPEKFDANLAINKDESNE